MPLGDRYAAWLAEGGRARESLLGHVPRRLTEHELQAHWFAGDFGREFTTTAGARVRIVQFGVWNFESGPDFAEAAVSIEGAEAIRGCIELDPDARDWERHGHATNPAYENVVLHLFTERGTPEFFTRTQRHRNVPQVLLDVTSLTRVAPNPLPEAKLGRCCSPLRELPEVKVREILLGAAEFRVRRKAATLTTLAELHGADEALFQAVAAALGYKSNKLPFTLLAQRLPLRLLTRAKTDADALLFGVSGFLTATDLGKFDQTTRSYLRELWEKWWPRRAEFERLAIPARLWKMTGQRPANHPQRRLAALAQVVRHWPRLRALARECDPKALHEFFSKLSDEYWEHHFTVTSKRSAVRMALVGASRVVELLANVFFPLALATDERRWVGYQSLPAAPSNRRATVAAIRLFGDPRHRSLLNTAAMQQGLLQIYEDFCLQDASDCIHCRFPEQLTRW